MGEHSLGPRSLNSLSSLPFVRNFAGGSRACFGRSRRRGIFHRRIRALLPLIIQFLLRPEPVVLRIAGAALILPDLVRPLPVFSSWPTAMAAADSASDMIDSLCL